MVSLKAFSRDIAPADRDCREEGAIVEHFHDEISSHLKEIAQTEPLNGAAADIVPLEHRPNEEGGSFDTHPEWRQDIDSIGQKARA